MAASPPPSPPPVTLPSLPTIATLNAKIRLGINTIPRPPPGLGLETTEKFKALERVHEAYQRLKLHGFTIEQLQAAGCFGNPNDRPMNLPRVVHPFYELHHWDMPKNFLEDIGHGFPGKWDINDNQIVADAMLPVLHLATMIMTRVMPWPWFDSLYLGDYLPVAAADCPDGCPTTSPVYSVHSFHLRKNQRVISAEEAAKILQTQHIPAFVNANIGIRIISRVAYIANSTSQTLAFGWWQGFELHNPPPENPRKWGSGFLTLSAEACLPLLRQDLTVSERLAQQFNVAKTICHETMHAFGSYIRTTVASMPLTGAEPFFEDEAISELGNSWEANTFGGKLTQIHDKIASQFHELALGSVVGDYPSFASFGNGQYDLSGKRKRNHQNFKLGAGATAAYWPLSGIYIENLQQESFWQAHVTKYGPDALLTPRVLGKWYEMDYPSPYPRYIQAASYPTVYRAGMSASQVTEEVARQASYFKAQVDADLKRTQLVFDELFRKARLYTNITALQAADFKAQIEFYNEACTMAARPARYSVATDAYDLLNALRLSDFLIIRIKSCFTMGEGVPRMGTSISARRAFLNMALADVLLLEGANPGDQAVVKLRQDIQQAIADNITESQQPPPASLI